MSLEAVQRIISRAVTDPEFREALKSDPDGVFTDRDVTPQEIVALKELDWDAVASVGEDVEVRAHAMQTAMRAGLPNIAAGCK
jgi:hypothetical protein